MPVAVLEAASALASTVGFVLGAFAMWLFCHYVARHDRDGRRE